MREHEERESGISISSYFYACFLRICTANCKADETVNVLPFSLIICIIVNLEGEKKNYSKNWHMPNKVTSNGRKDKWFAGS